MIIGQTLVASAAQAETYYTPWMSAAGNMATMVLDTLNISGASILVTVQTKTEEESDEAADGSGREFPMSSAVTTVTRTPWEVGKPFADGANPGLLQLIRFKIVVTNTQIDSHLGFVHFSLLNPSWQTH